MSLPNFNAVEVGQEIPVLKLPKISRTTLALYAGASGDHNPMHIDSDVAKKAGMDDVFAQGMLGMAYMSRVLIQWVPQLAIRKLSTRFAAITQLYAELNCTGKILEKMSENGEQLVRLELKVTDQNDEIKLLGEAVVALA